MLGGSALTDDFLNLWVYNGANFSTTALSTAKVEAYVGAPASLDPNNAISWNVTGLRPGGGSWRGIEPGEDHRRGHEI